jgi:hypothetical protein
VTPCVIGGGQPPELTWTVYSDTGRRSTSYRIESTYRSTPTGGPFCLSPTDPRATPADLWNGGIGGASYNFSTSKLVLATCNGSDLQKWNAAAVSTESTLRDIVER